MMLNCSRLLCYLSNKRFSREALPVAALGALKSGYAVAKGDVSNAYQEICRQAALDNLNEVAPALANYYSRAVLQPIPLFTRDVMGSSKSCGVLLVHPKVRSLVT